MDGFTDYDNEDFMSAKSRQSPKKTIGDMFPLNIRKKNKLAKNLERKAKDREFTRRRNISHQPSLGFTDPKEILREEEDLRQMDEEDREQYILFLEDMEELERHADFMYRIMMNGFINSVKREFLGM
ncbi:MAG: hypothetical protein Terrestrivirus8_15 [Terrestrivirus sp.]|uniref:Uncharacterized protein n=1 Tax=Terrestrivirus sp. TaxID=2487775 RepID=A0A3G4ZNQ5_9VIRU|nr:MAG: hypothetical protein Terrestrivirus8_15 [Terrestrivirus sp.]